MSDHVWGGEDVINLPMTGEIDDKGDCVRTEETIGFFHLLFLIVCTFSCFCCFTRHWHKDPLSGKVDRASLLESRRPKSGLVT